MSIEKKTASTLLEDTIPVKIGGRVYEAPQPTLGTLVRVSALIGEIEVGEVVDLDPEGITHEALKSGGEADKIAEVLAVFMVGAKVGKWWRKYLPEWISEEQRMKRRILESVTTREAVGIVTHFIQALNLADFFVLTAFLKGLDVTKRTKTEEESGTRTTAYGE